MQTCQESKKDFNLKNVVDNIHKLIVKKLKLNVNHQKS
jgi:hypothetical protein